VEDAARGQLKEIYTATDASGKDRKPTLQDYPAIPWDSLDLQQFNRIPAFVRPIMRRLGCEMSPMRKTAAVSDVKRSFPRPGITIVARHRGLI
jgi:hypothetical protein